MEIFSVPLVCLQLFFFLFQASVLCTNFLSWPCVPAALLLNHLQRWCFFSSCPYPDFTHSTQLFHPSRILQKHPTSPLLIYLENFHCWLVVDSLSFVLHNPRSPLQFFLHSFLCVLPPLWKQNRRAEQSRRTRLMLYSLDLGWFHLDNFSRFSIFCLTNTVITNDVFNDILLPSQDWAQKLQNLPESCWRMEIEFPSLFM